MQPETKMTDTSDHDAITKTVQQYVDGGKSGNSDAHEAGVPSGRDDLWLYQARTCSAGKSRSSLTGMTKTGRLLNFSPKSPTSTSPAPLRRCVLQLDNWTGHKFTDMFTLLKTEGEWKIISKVFYLHPEKLG